MTIDSTDVELPDGEALSTYMDDIKLSSRITVLVCRHEIRTTQPHLTAGALVERHGNVRVVGLVTAENARLVYIVGDIDDKQRAMIHKTGAKLIEIVA